MLPCSQISERSLRRGLDADWGPAAHALSQTCNRLAPCPAAPCYAFLPPAMQREMSSCGNCKYACASGVCVCMREKFGIWCASSGRCQQCNLSGKRHNYLPLMAIKKRPDRSGETATATARATAACLAGSEQEAHIQMPCTPSRPSAAAAAVQLKDLCSYPNRCEAPSKWARRHQSRLGCCCCSTALDWSSVRPGCCGAVAAMGRMCYENSRRFACHRLAPATATATVSHTMELPVPARQPRFDVLGSCEVLANLPAGASCRFAMLHPKRWQLACALCLALPCVACDTQCCRNATIVGSPRSGDSRIEVGDLARLLVNYWAVFTFVHWLSPKLAPFWLKCNPIFV